MARYRKKAVVIEAWQIGSEESMPEWLREAMDKETVVVSGMHEGHLRVSTLEGDMLGKPGDWIIQGVKGELYPCDNEIFEMTYDREEA